MNTRVLVSLSLLVGIGTVLHAVMPPLFLGMKADMLLTMMFLGILLFPERKNVLVLSLVTGIVSAITTAFPGGQIANMIDKPITAFCFFGLMLLIRSKQPTVISASILTAIGTLISGTIFLLTALIFFGLPDAFIALFAGVVLPTAIVNTIMMIVIFPIVQAILKRTNIAVQ
ncbi:tryptophan transporter [Bacillus solimangrovi]|uniref:Tryptophan transporter n=1 Tax=Bacillus solimangrovi TaxID=1305675 RepID=A0A1E5LCH8_9BACI|nr:tryptophan transporter [Bacillus solimangrovi]OEH91719.1 tryptophan transporter [Bacillus solimangrovi]